MPEPSSKNSVSAGEADVTDSRRFLNLGAISVSWLVMLACVNVMYVAFVLYGSKPQSAAVLATLTENGRQYYMPERELPIYVLGCTLTLIVSLGAACNWRRAACKRETDDPMFVLRGCTLSLMVTAVASGFNIAWLLGIRAAGVHFGVSRPVIALAMVAPVLLEVLLFYVCQTPDAKGSVRRLIIYLESELKVMAERVKGLISRSAPVTIQGGPRCQILRNLIDVSMVILISVLLYIPRSDLLAGSDYQLQQFHHWDFFAMGPAVGLLKGKALATQVYSQYGFGWPLLLAKLDPWLRLGYGHMYKIAVTYGCIYFCGLYWLLRRLLSNQAWAIAGVFLALRLQVFHGTRIDAPLWCVPSASILRTPCDVWVLLLLLAHWRSQKPVWLLLAGGLVGLALLFIIDTGVYLTLTFAAYNLLWLAAAPHSTALRTDVDGLSTGRYWSLIRRIGLSLAGFAIGAAVLFAGFYAASGPSVFSSGFVKQWLEVLWLYPSGISMVPMIEFPAGVIWSYWFVALFLGYINSCVLRFWCGYRQAESVIVLCLAILGLFYLIYYIGRSHPYLLFQLSGPFCIVVAYTAQQITYALRRGALKVRSMQGGFECIAVAAAGMVVLLVNPQFRGYPGLIRALLRPAPKHVICYFQDIQDVCVTSDNLSRVQAYVQLISEMRTYTKQGKSSAIIANDDTSAYVAARATLWNRYSPLLPALMTKSMLSDAEHRLSARPVDYVFLLRHDPAKDDYVPGLIHPETTDCWMALCSDTRRYYHFDHICGNYEVWRR